MDKVQLINSILAEDNFFSILGVPESASNKEIQVAYQRLIKTFNPDQFFSPDDKKKAKQAMDRLHHIIHVLKSPLERSEYQKTLKQQKNEGHYNEEDRLKMAEPHFKKGLFLEGRNSLDEAIAEYKEAIRFASWVAKYHSRLGLMLQKKGWEGYAQAEFKIALIYDATDALGLKYYRPNPEQPKSRGLPLMGFFRKQDKKVRLGDILIAEGVLNDQQLDLALKQQRKDKVPLGEILIRLGHIKPEHLARALIMQADLLESAGALAEEI